MAGLSPEAVRAFAQAFSRRGSIARPVGPPESVPYTKYVTGKALASLGTPVLDYLRALIAGGRGKLTVRADDDIRKVKDLFRAGVYTFPRDLSTLGDMRHIKASSLPAAKVLTHEAQHLGTLHLPERVRSPLFDALDEVAFGRNPSEGLTRVLDLTSPLKDELPSEIVAYAVELPSLFSPEELRAIYDARRQARRHLRSLLRQSKAQDSTVLRQE